MLWAAREIADRLENLMTYLKAMISLTESKRFKVLPAIVHAAKLLQNFTRCAYHCFVP